jgi:hypothetical protein
MAGAPPGNTNARKENRLWSDAVRKCIVQGKKLDALADVLIAKALEGDMVAIREIGDRLDGKPKQAIIGGDEDDNPVTVVTRIELVPMNGRGSD